MNTRWRPTSKAQFSGLFSTSQLWLERMTSYYPWTGDVTRSKLASTWESKPPYYKSNRSVEVYWFGSLSTQPLLTPLPPSKHINNIMHVQTNSFSTNELSAQYWYWDNCLRLNIPGLHKLLFRAEKGKTNKSIMDSGWAWTDCDACMCLTTAYKWLYNIRLDNLTLSGSCLTEFLVQGVDSLTVFCLYTANWWHCSAVCLPSWIPVSTRWIKVCEVVYATAFELQCFNH